MTRKSKILIGYAVMVCLFLMVVAAVSVQAAEDAGYVGASKCGMCHGDLAKGWLMTRHAKAFDTLKKKHQETLPGCVKCHVTGFEKDGGFIDEDLTPELAGVQCEVCHGPAARHVASFGKNKEELIAVPGEMVCRECHTTGQDPKFDYANKIRFLHGEDEKGGN